MRASTPGKRRRAGLGAAGPTPGLALPTLLSQTLVAFTIELDNEFEHRMPHRTTSHRSGYGPWLVSMAMYLNCMQFVSDQGITLSELENLARTPTNLNGMRRWGYVLVEPPPSGSRSRQPGRDWIIRTTTKGKMACEVWRPLFGVIEERWNKRFGSEQMEGLRESLLAVVRELDVELPDCLPILGYGLFSRGPMSERGQAKAGHADSDLALPMLLSKVLLAFAMEFESESEVSLAICANILRVLDEKGIRIRDLPQLSGVSKEAISMAMGVLEKKGLAIVEADPMGSRGKVARLTADGVEAEDRYRRSIVRIEEGWRERFGEDKIRKLREALEPLSGEALFGGLEPYPEGWRASVRRPEVLPHYPMVLHRGGYPDGS